MHQCKPGPSSTCTTPSSHFRHKDPPNTPNLQRGDAGWPGHLVLLEVSLDRNAVLGVQCPEQGQPQDAEQCGLHGKAEPSRAESWRQSAAVPESLSSPYLWAGVAGAPGEPALPPPRAVMQAGAGQSTKAKGQAGDPVNASLLLIRHICSRVPNCSAVKTASGQRSGRPAPSAAGQGRRPAHGEGRACSIHTGWPHSDAQ